jgi:hypothetical protein
MITHTVRPSALTIFYSTVVFKRNSVCSESVADLQHTCNASACASKWALLRVETCSGILYPRYSTEVRPRFASATDRRAYCTVFPHKKISLSSQYNSPRRVAAAIIFTVLSSRLYDTAQCGPSICVDVGTVQDRNYQSYRRSAFNPRHEDTCTCHDVVHGRFI